MTWRSQIYRALRVSNDVRAIQRGRVPQRIARRALGRASGRAIGRIVR